jgi:hypothetical protein
MGVKVGDLTAEKLDELTNGTGAPVIGTVQNLGPIVDVCLGCGSYASISLVTSEAAAAKCFRGPRYSYFRSQAADTVLRFRGLDLDNDPLLLCDAGANKICGFCLE